VTRGAIQVRSGRGEGVGELGAIKCGHGGSKAGRFI
jgi:hypothetical protein